MNVRELNQDLISSANHNSFNGNRGDISNKEYHTYADEILSWKISDKKKQKLLDKLYEKRMEILKHEAQHVSVMVAGASNYNSKKLDHGDTILRLSAEFCEWFEGLKAQLEESGSQLNEVQMLIEMIEHCDNRDRVGVESFMLKLAPLNTEKYIELFERLQPKYKWRKNNNLYKLYESAKNGTLKVVQKEVFFEDANFTAYRKGDRAYIKFVMRPARQLIVALKSRGWWWNSNERAWSTYLNRLDEEWVQSISSRYEQYI